MFCFNTQPPEGGWLVLPFGVVCRCVFQHTAARRRLAECAVLVFAFSCVSTHSRPKAAGTLPSFPVRRWRVSTHSRPKAAGTETMNSIPRPRSFNTQPPEGGWRVCVTENFVMFGFNTQPPEGGWVKVEHSDSPVRVSTHSRPKAAGSTCRQTRC